MIMHTRRFMSKVYRVDGRSGQRADFRYTSENNIFILFKYTLPFILRGSLCLKYSVRSYIIYVHLWLKLLKHAGK